MMNLLKRLTFLSLLSSLLLVWSSATSKPITALNGRFLSPVGNTPPTVLVDSGVTSFTLLPPRIFWNDSPPCLSIPTRTLSAAEDGPEIVSRIATYGGPIRQLFYVPEVPDECTPYAIQSNIVADDNYVYWSDEQGLVRLSIYANVGDDPELVSTTIVTGDSEEPVELTDAGDDIYAIVPNANDTFSLWQVKKSDFSAQHVVTRNGPIAKLSYDQEYGLFWVDYSTGSGNLYRTVETDAGFLLILIEEGGVTAYHAEGRREECTPSCHDVSYVFIAKDDHIDRYDIIGQYTVYNIYVSDDPDGGIYELVSDEDRLFLLENHPTTQYGVYDFLLWRTGRSGGTAELLYVQTQEDFLGYLSTDNTYLYWKDHSGLLNPQLLKMPNDVEALPLTNLAIDRVEVTQGIQSTDHSVLLIQNRRTFVRVLAYADGPPVEGVTAYLYRTDANGDVLSGPVLPANDNGTHLTLTNEVSAESLEGNFWFELPLAWTTISPLRLQVELNPTNDPYELEVDQEDNMALANLPMVVSPRLEVNFYVLSYDVGNNTYTPRDFKDVQQTFSWIRRVYPLASTPGFGNDPSPGFRPTIIEANWGEELGSRVLQYHPSCWLLFNDDDRSLCASTFANNVLMSLKLIDQSNAVYYGLISDEAAFPRGRGMTGWGVASGPAGDFCCGSGSWDDDGAYTDWYTGHEMGHAIGRSHPSAGSATCGNSADDPNYPYSGAVIGLKGLMWGFDVGDSLFGIDPAVLSAPTWHDVMSYCDFQWVSDYTYEGLYGMLMAWPQRRPLSIAPAGTELLGVYGVLAPTAGLAEMQLVQHFNTGSAIPDLIPGSYSIRLLNGQGQLLANYPFTPHPLEDGTGDRSGFSFAQVVDWVAGTAVIQIIDLADETVMAETAVSQNPPLVSNIALQNPPNPVSGPVTLAWTATDPDGDALTFDLFYSHDYGATFQPVQMGISGSSTAVDMDNLGGGAGIFRITASDGVHLHTAESPMYAVADKLPQPIITNPGDGNIIQWGQTVQLMGTAFDLQYGTVDESELVWEQGGSRVPLGTGSVITVDELPVGEVEIFLTATNNAGLSATTSITLIVHDDLELPGPTLIAAPLQVGWHVAPESTELQTAEISLQNIGSGSLTWTVAENANWLTLGATSGDTPGTLSLTADPTGLGDAQSWTTTLTVTGYDAANQETGTVQVQVVLTAGAVWFTEPPEKIYLPLIIRP